MAQEREFSHITVTPHAEEEVVIHVGAPTPNQPSVPAEKLPDTPQPSAASLRESGQGQKADSAAPVPDETIAAPVLDEKKKNGKQDSYRETTLEDLERQPMPLTQKIVLVAAVLLLVGFVVYYFFLR